MAAARQSQEPVAEQPRYRLKTSMYRGSDLLPGGTIIEPTPAELAAFGDIMELIPTREQVAAEQQEQLAAERAALAQKEAAAAQVAA